MPLSNNDSRFGLSPVRPEPGIPPVRTAEEFTNPVSAAMRRRTAAVCVIFAAISIPINLNSNGSVRVAAASAKFALPLPVTCPEMTVALETVRIRPAP